MLSDQDIAKETRRRRILIDPPPPVSRLQPASVDVTLGGTVRVFDAPRGPAGRTVVRLDAIPADLTEEIQIGDGFRLRPGDFVLATTAERVTLPGNICAFLHGRSTLGRLGLAVHCTAGLVDPGYSGTVTLEVSNVGELILELRAGDPIGQLTFERMTSAALRPYGAPGLGSRYQDQDGTTPPRGHSRPVRPVRPVEAAPARPVAPVLWLHPGGG